MEQNNAISPIKPKQPIVDIGLVSLVQLGIFSGIALIIIWACIAELDIAISSRGEIVSLTDVEKIQHLEGGILDEMLVTEDSYVYKGQPVARLKSLERNAKLNSMRFEMVETNMEVEKLTALIENKEPNFNQYSDDERLINWHRNMWLQESKNNEASEALLIHDINHKNKLVDSMQSRLKTLKRHSDVISEQLRIKEQLYKENKISHMQVLDARIARKNIERELQNLDESILNEQFLLKKTAKQLDAMRLSKIVEYQETRSKLRKELNKQSQQLPNIEDQVKRLIVTSPIDGYVNKIHFNYKSAIIPPSESIADISPVRSGLIGEAKIPRKDIGFVEIGQNVRVKMDTFPFTKYGSISGEVIGISKNSYEEKDEKFYIAKIALSDEYLQYKEMKYHISSDMEFVADIKTGSRKVIDYALKPIVLALEQSFSQR